MLMVLVLVKWRVKLMHLHPAMMRVVGRVRAAGKHSNQQQPAWSGALPSLAANPP
jgi:hypothetical protein